MCPIAVFVMIIPQPPHPFQRKNDESTIIIRPDTTPAISSPQDYLKDTSPSTSLSDDRDSDENDTKPTSSDSSSNNPVRFGHSAPSPHEFYTLRKKVKTLKKHMNEFEHDKMKLASDNRKNKKEK